MRTSNNLHNCETGSQACVRAFAPRRSICAYTVRFRVHFASLLNSQRQNTGLPSAYLLTTINWLSCCGGSPAFLVVRALVQLHSTICHSEKVCSAFNRHCQTDTSLLGRQLSCKLLSYIDSYRAVSRSKKSPLSVTLSHKGLASCLYWHIGNGNCNALARCACVQRVRRALPLSLMMQLGRRLTPGGVELQGPPAQMQQAAVLVRLLLDSLTTCYTTMTISKPPPPSLLPPSILYSHQLSSSPLSPHLHHSLHFHVCIIISWLLSMVLGILPPGS